MIRPLQPGDVEAVDRVANAALRRMHEVYDDGPPWPERTPAQVERSHARIRHLRSTDPDGSWVAEEDGEVVGVALALRRGPMWFLSLLTVAVDRQARGTGRALLEAALRTAEGAGAAWITSTADPKALRRYALAGFRPRPAYAASGPLDRATVPAGLGVREGTVDADGDLVEDVVVRLRGAAYGPDLALLGRFGRLVVAEDGADRGFAVLNERGVACLGATSEALAQRLLWDALARVEGEVEVDWLTAEQQWAVDVALAARLPLRPGPSVCVRSQLGPLAPYLPGGAYG